MLHLVLIGQVVSEEKMFEYYGNIHVYCPGVGAYELLGTIFSESLIFSPTAHFLQELVLLRISCKNFTLNDIVKVFPIQMHW